jgi:hypothetical protein
MLPCGPQERDAFQDYSLHAVMLYRQYLRTVHGDIAHWNARWGTAHRDWASFHPPGLHQHGGVWNSSLGDTSYWDWQHFRHRRLHFVHETACQHVAAHGLPCILHFGEFFAATDAIYASGAVFTLAASPWLDYLVVDSNFISAALLRNDVRIVQLLLAAMKPFGKPVFFEGAFEEFKDPELHRKVGPLGAAAHRRQRQQGHACLRACWALCVHSANQGGWPTCLGWLPGRLLCSTHRCVLSRP